MNSGRFKLYVKPARKPWGLLETFPYDNAQKKGEQRKAVLERAQMSRTLWQINYQAFTDAMFCLEEQANEWSVSIHLEGSRRDRKKGSLERKIPSWKKGNHK